VFSPFFFAFFAIASGDPPDLLTYHTHIPFPSSGDAARAAAGALAASASTTTATMRVCAVRVVIA
jgi:hypothetical protein